MYAGVSWINSWYIWILWLFFCPGMLSKKSWLLLEGGGAFLKMSPLAWERLFDSRATLVGRDSSNAHVKPSARQRGASVTRMEFDATPFAIRIGAVTIMTMISSKQSIALDMYFHFHQSSWVLQLAALMVFKIQQWSLSLLCVMASCRSATFTFY